MNYKLFECDPQEIKQNVNPNFIYNRYDLWENVKSENVRFWKYEDDNRQLAFESLESDGTLQVGLWLTETDDEAFCNIKKELFIGFPKIKKICVSNALFSHEGAIEHHHRHILLPETSEELDLRLSSKGRYNIKREKRILAQDFGSYEIVNLKATDKSAEDFWKKYFEYKKVTHNTDYGLSAEEYCRQYHVSDIYALLLGENKTIASVVLSCEQTPIVYIENLTYDTGLSKYSPGQVLYDEYLKALIQKGVKCIYLLGGNYFYKKRYNSEEQTVYDITEYRSRFIYYKQKLIGFAKRGYRKLFS